MDKLDSEVEDVIESELEKLEMIKEELGRKLTQQQREERMSALSFIVAKRRDEAVIAKSTSGVETQMREDLDYYIGKDEFSDSSTTYTKPRSTTGGITANNDANSTDQCTEFFNITRPFVDAATARMGDILLPAGNWNFSIKPTPEPDLEGLENDPKPVTTPDGQPVMGPDGTPQTVGGLISEKLTEADKRVKILEQRVRDKLIECQFTAESRKVIEDAGKMGTGILKGPVPVSRKSVTVKDGAIKINIETVPASKRVDPFNFFPDPNCGENIQDGSYVIEREYLTARQLKELSGKNGFIPSAIDKVLIEGPSKINLTPESQKVEKTTQDDERFEVWYYYGDVDLEDIKVFDENIDDSETRSFVSATLVLVNDTIIKGHINPFDTGDYPYDVFPWQRVNGSVWGIGVARQGRTPQKMLLAATRALMDNMALSAGPMIGVNRDAIVPADGSWRLRRNKVFFLRNDADVRSVGDAIMSITIPSMQAELTGIIQLALKYMEDATGVTFLLQGQQGTAPDTVGGMAMVHQNATAFIRRTARLYDECITEPHIRRYYDHIMKITPDNEKGDARIEATGSSALVEREVQLMQMQQILQMAVDPEFGLSKKKVAAEMLSIWKYDPSKFAMDRDELEALKNAQPPVEPTVEAAKIRTEGEIEVAKIKTEAQMEKIRTDVDRDALYADGVRERNQMTYEQRQQELELKRELALLQYAHEQQMKLEDVKASLADTSMKLAVQKELSAAEKEVPVSITPPTEPAGRAEPGRGFEQ